MKHQLNYKTFMEIDGNTLIEDHSIICSTWDHAKAIEYDLLNGDFGDIKCFDIDIQPIIYSNFDLPF